MRKRASWQRGFFFDWAFCDSANRGDMENMGKIGMKNG